MQLTRFIKRFPKEDQILSQIPIKITNKYLAILF